MRGSSHLVCGDIITPLVALADGRVMRQVQSGIMEGIDNANRKKAKHDMPEFPTDIYTEPAHVDPDTLNNLGPLKPLAGVWEGMRGLDVHPETEGAVKQAYRERYELQPIDPQTNGPQLFYGLRYHVFITKPAQSGTFHDQVGYWLWEPATGTIIQTLAIPRGQVAMALGTAARDATRFELRCEFGSPHNGTLANPFLDYAFRTIEFRVSVAVNDDGSWSYEQDTVLKVARSDELFHHTDRNTLYRIAAPTPNPLMRRNS